MFDSIAVEWKSSHLKELIPEFYYMPEFLINVSGINFGKKFNSEYVSNVVIIYLIVETSSVG